MLVNEGGSAGGCREKKLFGVVGRGGGLQVVEGEGFAAILRLSAGKANRLETDIKPTWKRRESTDGNMQSAASRRAGKTTGKPESLPVPPRWVLNDERTPVQRFGALECYLVFKEPREVYRAMEGNGRKKFGI
jgi:hypothetical protein